MFNLQSLTLSCRISEPKIVFWNCNCNLEILSLIHIIYINLKLCLCTFTYSLGRDPPIYSKLGMHIPWNQENISEWPRHQESVLGSSPCEDGFCSLESKHDRRRMLRSKLFLLQETRPHHQKLSCVWVPLIVSGAKN
jgi:hypothetical protein